jgi:uridine monophosphate synthetase
MNHAEIALKLYDIGAIKFGQFKLKSGIHSPIYIDLREIISFPDLLKGVSEVIWERTQGKKFDRMCGVPYTALPIVSYLSVAYNQPMVMRRKEAKEYGTKKIVEGVFKQGQSCLVVEDIITSGASIMETISPLEEAGLVINDIIVFLDREQGGSQRVAENGYNIDSVFKLTDILALLQRHTRIDTQTYQQVVSFIKGGT